MGTFYPWSHCLSPPSPQVRCCTGSSLCSAPSWSSTNTQSLTPCSQKVPEINMDTHRGYIQLPHGRKTGQKQKKRRCKQSHWPFHPWCMKSGCGYSCSLSPIYSCEMQYIILTGSLALGIFLQLFFQVSILSILERIVFR